MDRAYGALGLVVLMALAWLLSEHRRRLDWRLVLAGVGLQLGVAFVLIKVPVINDAFLAANVLVEVLEQATAAGTTFAFGYLGGGPLPFEEPWPGAAFVFALRALPLILVVSALSAVLFYWRVIPVVVNAFSFCLKKTMGVGGALGIGVSANIFVGMVEAPLLVRPYLAQMTRSELFSLMCAGMATIAGTMLVVYASILGPVIPEALGHILIASIVSAPAAILLSRIMIPETGEVTTGVIVPPQTATSTMDAAVKGTAQGVKLLINVVALLIVFVALAEMANLLLALGPDAAGAPLTLQRLLGWLMAPLVWIIGVPWSEAVTAGALMGTKVVLNEFIAYLDMAALPEGALSEKSRVIMVYAMCGFANFGSVGIMVGGLSAMAPDRRDEIVGLGLKSLVAGTLATLMTGAVVGMLY
ncbi:NupC/NupG family nucleoside CNT transporter [Pseudodesulfovibrio pelocollis]|uniref:NupC/NupG family nucleoside CNT transporter n=1 Tax=Pseudodesulfovibrio pelocollis TaxID=3051432 RepID=UPI00255A830B|nr:nucleoside transporter C-terminal domain-containing protein [Pseudodesulfovibrio sp. SB368]